jgi:osmotically-inducible protein OsmY
MVDDTTLQSMVMDELAWVPNVDAAHIGVSAHDGIVTLSGIVSSLAEKFAAERAARRVKGVRGIAEKILVHPPSAHKCADEEIAERAVRMLAWDVEVPDAQLQIKVEAGVVTLTGFVSHQFQKQAAEHDIRRLSGVTAIINLIEVRWSGDQSPYPANLHRNIEDALLRSAELEAANIIVTVRDRKATLQGRVKSWWERGIAENAVWAAPGIVEVDNRLVVAN